MKINSLKSLFSKILPKLKIALSIFVVLGLVLVTAVYYFPDIDTQKYNFLEYEYSTNREMIAQESLQDTASDGSAIDPKCKSTFFDHQKKQTKSVVFFHGLTNCPAQFEGLGKVFYEAGYNVYIPRLHGHGYTDKMTSSLEKITTEDILKDLEKNYKIGTGLGDNLTFVGISVGGVLASWGTYHLPKVKQAIIINPLFAPTTTTEWQIPAIQKFLNWGFNVFLWWDDKNKEKIEGPKYAYPRYSTKAIQAFLRLSVDLNQKINSKKQNFDQSHKNISFVTLQSDPAVNNSVSLDIASRWANNPEVSVWLYQIPTSTISIHDVIDSNQIGSKPELIYPFLLKISQTELQLEK